MGSASTNLFRGRSAQPCNAIIKISTETPVQKYMVVEKFRAGCLDAIYHRVEQRGRLLPDGLHYLNSWVNRERMICFQLMETADATLFDHWITHWTDLAEFEIYPIDN